jgi:2-keto-4-pentenoate hydratase/2-oxohepta-3-ene-1,7-dioic acid hydratase in catechol pathway
MRLVTFRERAGGRTQPGIVIDDRVLPLDTIARDMLGFIEQGDRALEAARGMRDGAKSVPLGDVELCAPIEAPRRNIVCVGLNYAEHVAESKSVAGADAPKYPVFFTKPPTCVIGPDDEIPWHPRVSTSIDWEVELAVIIGRTCSDVDEATALEYVFGYTVANDVTARDLQARHQQWYKGKGLDGFCPLGPAIVTADDIPDPHALDISLRLNGETKQQSNTKHMIFTVARLIAEWSAGMTLLAGDILLTGTPSGVGVGRTPQEFLKPGDVVEAEIGNIGVLRNTVGGAEGP